MASNGVILLNLENRNAAEFQRLSVPDSYEKASGALTSGTYVTVYKWLYEGFMLAPSLCDAVDADDHINLVDRTNGGVLSVYPDDTITLEGIPVEGDLIDLTVSSNGVYYPPEGKRGFSSVRANVDLVPHPSRVLELNVIENGTWVAPFGYDGFNPVNVNIAPEPEPSPGPTPSVYNGYRIRLGHVTGYDWYDPYIIIRQANVVNGVEQSVDDDSIYFKPSLRFAVEDNDYTAAFYNEYNQGEFGMFLSYIGSGLVNVRLYSVVSGLSYCRVPQSGSPVISSLPGRSSSTTVKFDVPSDQDWIDILIWRNDT